MTTKTQPGLTLWRVVLTMVVYHGAFVVGFLLWAPVLAWKMLLNPAYRHGILQRMGHVAPTPVGKPVVWIHGVSVGEIKAAGRLIARFRELYPDVELVVSSTTPTGHALARQLHPELRVFYFPMDFAGFPRRALERIRPECVLLMELEVWPNFLQRAARRGIAVVVVNGRMSQRSFRGYSKIRWLLPQFDLIDRFCVQDESYRDRLLRLGVRPDRISVTGNIKYDSVALKPPSSESAAVRGWLAPDDRAVLVCGSTHGDEELWLVRLARRVQARLDRPVRVVLAPRHPERAAGVRQTLAAEGVPCVPWSRAAVERVALADDAVVLVDTIGHLETFYSACDVAFVGGSLVPHGGQNMLEPAALGRAVVFGPHVANFAADVRNLLAAGAAVQVSGVSELESVLADLLADEPRRHQLGGRAVALIERSLGATERTLEVLAPLLARHGIEHGDLRSTATAPQRREPEPRRHGLLPG